MTDRRKETPHVVGQSPLAGFATLTGDADEPMTEEQAAVLRDLAERAGEPVDEEMTRGRAEERIAALRETLGEG